VSGGGSGIGLASAARLAADLAHVAICGRREEKLAKAEAEIAPVVGAGGSIRSIVADVTVEEQVAPSRLQNRWAGSTTTWPTSRSAGWER
jgi:NAD(P)-dependent dehydrogenase (short-subunit alcohol dehydrogenase family)